VKFKPFILIVGLFRSGTTLCQELLTEKGKSFVFHEPRFFDMHWQFENYDRKYWREKWGLELTEFANTADLWEYMMETLNLQIGSKEIRNSASMGYYDSWGGNMRLLVIDRRPAEIYKSCYSMFMRSNDSFRWNPRYSPFSPINIFRELMPEIKNINNLWNHIHPDCRMVVKYEDMVKPDNKLFLEFLYHFLESDVKAPEIGKYHSILPRGHYETNLHKGGITDRAVGFSGISNKLKDEARHFEELMEGSKQWLQN